MSDEEARTFEELWLVALSMEMIRRELEAGYVDEVAELERLYKL